jgi:hypothetical protein
VIFDRSDKTSDIAMCYLCIILIKPD